MATPPENAAPYVFLSYASADRERALQIADRLEASGIRVWIDRKSIAGGTSWTAEIVEGVKGCAALVVLISVASVRSPNVQQELQLAWEYRRALLPLRLDGTTLPASFEYVLTGRQWVDLLDNAGDVWLPLTLRSLALLGLGMPASNVGELAGRSAQGADPLRPSAAPLPRHNLPAPVTTFIGRVKELEEAKQLLAMSRLLTLTGAGGCGKTRLALQLAREVIDIYPDGVWLVELAALTDETLVPQTLLATLGLRSSPDQPILATISEYLRERHVLLVVDNCEHLVSACADLVANLLRSCPKLKVLVTSRELLGVSGETVRSVPSLSLPNPQQAISVEALQDAEAVHLFVDRAAAVQPGFALTTQNAAAIAQICLRLDGIPLAIELAAARLRGLAVEQIAARLDDRFRLLTGGSRTALRRQQTLRAAVDWSHELLVASERILFRRLAIFAGGWSLEAAESICADDHLPTVNVLDLLLQLVDKSLVIVDETQRVARYHLLETIRQYASEKLVDAGEANVLRNRHTDWFLLLAERAGSFTLFRDSRRDLAELDRERDNVRASLNWAIEEGNAGAALRFVGALPWYWVARGVLNEGNDLAVCALALGPPAEQSILRADALNAAALVAFYRGDPAARQWNEAALEIAREHQYSPGVWFALLNLAAIAREKGDLTVAQGYNEEGLAVARAVGDRYGIVAHTQNLGYLALERSDFSGARQYFEAVLTLVSDEPTSARGRAVWGLAQVALGLGNPVQARELLRWSLTLHYELGDIVGTGIVLTGFVRLAFAEGDPSRALRLVAGREALRVVLGTYGDVPDALAAAIRRSVDPAAADTIWAEGQTMNLDQIVSYALHEGGGESARAATTLVEPR